MSAPESLARLVSLIAELTLREQSDAPAIGLDDLAASFGVTRADIERDIRTLTRLGEEADSDWLLSLRVWQQGDRVSVSSQGQFRRPIRLNADEMLAVQVALVSVGELDLAARIGDAPSPLRLDCRPPFAPYSEETSLLHAISDRLRMVFHYAGEGQALPRVRTIQPHQLVEYRGRVYVVAWCEDTNDWRRFRLDRILRPLEMGAAFEPRADFVPVTHPKDVFRAGTVEEVTVRYRGGAARWARERFPQADTEADGSVLVRFNVANPDWLIRTVLEVGSDAEVVEPIEYRRRLRDAVA